MALSLGVQRGDIIFIADHKLVVRDVLPPPTPRHGKLIIVSIDGGEEVTVADGEKTRILPDVYVFSGWSDGSSGSRLAFEAPRSVPITRAGYAAG